jgi:hypothetical protein
MGCNLGEDVFLTEEATNSEQNNDGSQQQSGNDLEHDGGDVDTLLADLNKEWHTNHVPYVDVKLDNSKENGTAILEHASFHDNNSSSHDHMLPSSSSHTCNVPNHVPIIADVKLDKSKDNGTASMVHGCLTS